MSHVAFDSFKSKIDAVLKKLKAEHHSIVTAESCTAGLLSALLSRGDGAGEVLEGAFVCYTKHHKATALGVSPQLLKEKTAVAAEVAAAMAEGALERSSADCVLAVTGVLGPEPDEDANPVGLVLIARQWRGEEPKIERHDFGELPHEELCSRTLSAALDLIGAPMHCRLEENLAH